MITLEGAKTTCQTRPVGVRLRQYGTGATGDRDRVLATIKELVADRGKLTQRPLAGVKVLGSHPRVNGKIAAVGILLRRADRARAR